MRSDFVFVGRVLLSGSLGLCSVNLGAYGGFCGAAQPLAVAADETPDGVYVDPEQAGPEFPLQGEFVGVLEADGNNWGVQVIALGKGQYQVIGLPGGLPGDGYRPDTSRKEALGSRQGDVVRAEGDNFKVELSSDHASVFGLDGQLYGKLARVHRQSPTLGAPPPDGAVVLFDGSTAEHFENGRLVQGDLLLSDCTSRQAFGDHTLHIEFRTPFKPLARGQARGNSGVYIQSRYEIQVLDSFGLEARDNHGGGIYQVAAPRVNMSYPPLSWQTYDVDFTAARYDDQGEKVANARVTIRHNGVLIHEDLELPQHTPGRDVEGPSDGPLYLQGHGNPVVFRNIWVVPR
jgi:hypothetical protein